MKFFKGTALVFLLAVATGHAQPALNISTLGGNHVMLTWAVTNSGFGLEYADNPASTNWQQVTANVTNALCVVMDSPANSARFYRLVSPFGANLSPMFAPGTTLLANGDPYYPDLPLYFNIDSLSQAAGLFFNGSAIIDPASPTNNSLSYIWTIDSDNLGDDLISPIITGTATPIISLGSPALPAGEYYFYLTVTSNYSHLSTTWEIDASNIRGGGGFGGPWYYGLAVPRYEGHLYGYSEVVGFY